MVTYVSLVPFIPHFFPLHFQLSLRSCLVSNRNPLRPSFHSFTFPSQARSLRVITCIIPWILYVTKREPPTKGSRRADGHGLIRGGIDALWPYRDSWGRQATRRRCTEFLVHLYTCMPDPRLTRGSPGRVATPAAAAPPPRHAAFSLAAALLSKVSGEVVRAELP